MVFYGSRLQLVGNTALGLLMKRKKSENHIHSEKNHFLKEVLRLHVGQSHSCKKTFWQLYFKYTKLGLEQNQTQIDAFNVYF